MEGGKTGKREGWQKEGRERGDEGEIDEVVREERSEVS